MNPGTLYIIASPSGGGKSSLIQALLKLNANLVVSVSHTTRPMRPGERDGADYHFVTPSVFDKLIQAGAFLEHADVFGHAYGTSRHTVLEFLAQGVDVILAIDWQGARQIKHLLPDTVTIFILPPSTAALAERLRLRGQDNEDVIALRMRAAVTELSHYGEFDYLVLNEDFHSAITDLLAIIHARQLRCAAQTRKLAALLADLLA